MIGSLFKPGDTPLHRAPAAAKLAGLATAGGLLFLTDSTPLLGLAAVVAFGAVLSTGVALGTARQQLTGPLVILLILSLVNGLLVSWPHATVVLLRLLALLLAGYAVTLTTRTSDLLAFLERLLSPADRLGLVDASKVSLGISLAMRFIPAIFDQASAIREAQAARGLGRHPLALIVPLLVRTIKAADDIAAAIDARCYPPPKRSTPDIPRWRKHP